MEGRSRLPLRASIKGWTIRQVDLPVWGEKKRSGDSARTSPLKNPLPCYIERSLVSRTMPRRGGGTGIEHGRAIRRYTRDQILFSENREDTKYKPLLPSNKMFFVGVE